MSGDRLVVRRHGNAVRVHTRHQVDRRRRRRDGRIVGSSEDVSDRGSPSNGPAISPISFSLALEAGGLGTWRWDMASRRHRVGRAARRAVRPRCRAASTAVSTTYVARCSPGRSRRGARDVAEAVRTHRPTGRTPRGVAGRLGPLDRRRRRRHARRRRRGHRHRRLRRWTSPTAVEQEVERQRLRPRRLVARRRRRTAPAGAARVPGADQRSPERLDDRARGDGERDEARRCPGSATGARSTCCRSTAGRPRRRGRPRRPGHGQLRPRAAEAVPVRPRSHRRAFRAVIRTGVTEFHPEHHRRPARLDSSIDEEAREVVVEARPRVGDHRAHQEARSRSSARCSSSHRRVARRYTPTTSRSPRRSPGASPRASRTCGSTDEQRRDRPDAATQPAADRRSPAIAGHRHRRAVLAARRGDRGRWRLLRRVRARATTRVAIVLGDVCGTGPAAARSPVWRATRSATAPGTATTTDAVLRSLNRAVRRSGTRRS